MKMNSPPEGEEIMTKKEVRLTKLVFLLLGVVMGFLFSPIKMGTHVTVRNSCGKGKDSKERRRKSDEDTGY